MKEHNGLGIPLYINENARSIRYEIGTKVRYQLRVIPEFKFFIDDSLDYIDRIDELLKK